MSINTVFLETEILKRLHQLFNSVYIRFIILMLTILTDFHRPLPKRYHNV